MIPNTEGVRHARVLHARARCAELRARHDGCPLVLTGVSAVAWATGALSDPIDRVAATDPVWVVARDDGATLVVSSVEVARLTREHDLEQLGFDVVAAPWQEAGSHARAAERVTGRPLADCLVDAPVDGVGVDLSVDLTAARLVLGDAERSVLEGLAGVATEAVESAALAWRPGVSTDYEVAAEVAVHLERHGAQAVCLIVGGDERVREFRHPLAVGARIDRLVMVVVVARALGLHVALTRIRSTVPDPQLDERVRSCDEVLATVMAASRDGATWGDAYDALGAGYDAVGSPGAWREHFQGGPIGYGQREFELAPGLTDSPWWHRRVDVGTAVAWNPSLAGGAKIEDTYVLDAAGPTLLTGGTWPRASSSSGTSVLVREGE